MPALKKNNDTFVVAIVLPSLKRSYRTVYLVAIETDHILVSVNKSLAINYVSMIEATEATKKIASLPCQDCSGEIKAMPDEILNIVTMRQLGGEIPF